jgi:cupin superfamily acireductone dioxygenase involved in methionine salvage
MQTISIRLDDETITKIEDLRGTEHKSDFYRKLIEHALITFVRKDLQSDDKKITSDCTILQARNESLEELIKAKNENIKDLQNQIGFLTQDHVRISGQLDRLLMPSQEEQKEKGKKWFEFWKK